MPRDKEKHNKTNKKYLQTPKGRATQKRGTEKNILKARIIAKNLRKHGCCICGSTYKLDFHHINPQDKLFELSSTGLNHTNDKILEEFYKCMLLCRKCHRQIHTKEVIR